MLPELDNIIAEYSAETLPELILSSNALGYSKYTMKSMMTWSLRNIKTNLPKFLKKIEVNFFLNLLQRTESVIAGGFVLQSLLGEVWPKSDLDIYCYQRHLKN